MFISSRDPAYRDFIEVAKERENVIVLRTFSKVYGLGGIRVGYAVAHRDVIYRLAPFSMGLLGRNVLSVHAAAAALEDEEHVRRSRQAVWDGNDYLTAEAGADRRPGRAQPRVFSLGRLRPGDAAHRPPVMVQAGHGPRGRRPVGLTESHPNFDGFEGRE